MPIIPSWIEHLTQELDRDVRTLRYFLTEPNNQVGVFRIDDGIVVEVQVSKYDEREIPTVIEHEQRYLHTGSPDILPVILDIYGKDRYNPSRDHFISLTDMDVSDRVRVRVLGPGEYKGIDPEQIDNWDIITKGYV